MNDLALDMHDTLPLGSQVTTFKPWYKGMDNVFLVETYHGNTVGWVSAVCDKYNLDSVQESERNKVKEPAYE